MLDKKFELDDVVFIAKDIIQESYDGMPAYMLAHRGDAVKIRRLCESYAYVSHAGVLDNSFYVYPHEILLTDPLITVEEQRAYLKRENLKSLDERFVHEDESFITGEKNVN